MSSATNARTESVVGTTGSGLLVRAYIQALEKMGKLQEVRGRLSPGAAALLTTPPMRTAWFDAAWFEEVFTVMAQVLGREGCRRIGYETARTNSGGVLAPVVRATSALFGVSPVTFFERMGPVCSVLVRNVRFDFAATGARTGTLTLRISQPAADGFHASWEGACQYILETCGVKKGHVAHVRLEDGGRTAHIDISW